MKTQKDYEELLKLLNSIKVNFIDLKNLIKIKKASGRNQDKADLELLSIVKKF